LSLHDALPISWAFIFRRIDDIPRHPAQLYESIAYFLVFFFVFNIYRNNYSKIGNGFYFGLSIFLLCIMRFLIEFLKIDQVDFERGMLLNMGQILSLPFIVIGLFLIIRSLYRNKGHLQSVR